MELWDLYDRNCKPLGKTHIRGEKIPAGEYHIVVDIVSVNQKNQLLITKRHPHKKFGNQWEITGGSAISGEEPIDAAIRELFEETGLKAKRNQLLHCGTLVRDKSRCIHEFYFYKGNFSAEDIVLQEGETIDFKLVNSKQLYQMVLEGEFLPFVYDRLKVIYNEYMDL